MKKEMKFDELVQWCLDRITIPHTDTYIERGSCIEHTVKYENGDEYRHIEIYKNSQEKYIQDAINGEVVESGNFVFQDFGWRKVMA